ncbi:hypothetical protein H0G86_011493 [Trichoderma simmonsii]|uniref:Peptidase S8/S53 domain-containing protein n=1 Tax=Trichoderma simmonsii TaxID=1491479 RepID=A0A8G0LRW8_9HYPO|nr:hypothetical protein H0G86_011493 [Trichoderma simmonsii]
MWDAIERKIATKVTPEDKSSYLYYEKEEIEDVIKFRFNLEGASFIIDRSYIKKIEKYSRLKFETALEFVRLPYWKPAHATRSDKLLKDTSGEQDIEPDPYIHLFRYMWNQGTTKIFSLEVTDDGPEPHTNASIREALQGKALESPSPLKFEIETWMWKKYDICTETVASAAPTARHVWLWSSGNTAVLRGWACGSGLSGMKELENLTVVINPKNVKDHEDCENYLEDFKKDIIERCPRLSLKDINVQIYPLYPTSLEVSGEGATKVGSNNLPQNADKKSKKPTDWLHELSLFKEFIVNLARKSDLAVKVAVIDDGCRLADFKGAEPTGNSFCADDRAYFAGQCEHGTSMARCIREVCPTASLYIARLDVTGKEEAQPFTVKSCCKALRWAIAVGVDVICMSWTFATKELGEDAYEAEFRQLITEADKQNIILFASLPDKGPTSLVSDFAPVSFKEVIKIGSATVYGEVIPDNRFAGADFLLPGEDSQEGKETVKGSSYATAYASGLAAVVLLTIRLYKIHHGSSDPDEIKKIEDTARTRKGMEEIFKRLSPGDLKKEKNVYVRPYLIFGQKAENFDISDEGKQKTLKRIVNDFFHGK